MDKLLSYKGYKGSIEVDLKDGCLYGKVLFIRDLINYEANTLPELEAAFQESVDEYLEDCAELGVEPNISLSGTFQVRIGSDLHEYAATEALKAGVSLNEWVRRLVDLDRCGRHEIHNHTHTTHHHNRVVLVSKNEGRMEPIWQEGLEYQISPQLRRH